MKRLNLIIGKKQIILACLTLILGIAVYMNYALSSSDDDIAQNVMSNDAQAADSGNYGDAAFVSAEGASDYFAQVRLSRMTSRDEAVETLSVILNGGDLSDEETATYTNESITLSKLSESESKIENLIKAQGFNDCVVYLNDSTANIVVKSDGLEAAQAAQIKDILLTEVTIPAENIRIFEVK
ncbi:MAG: SpoIIIAH-like family protein [Oscillospiraceae bacterium]